MSDAKIHMQTIFFVQHDPMPSNSSDASTPSTPPESLTESFIKSSTKETKSLSTKSSGRPHQSKTMAALMADLSSIDLRHSAHS